MQPDNITCASDNYKSEQEYLVREQKTLDKFIAGSGCCLVCFNCDPEQLEEHHLAGRKHSDLTVTLCANHHLKLSRNQRIWPKEWLGRDIPPYKRKAFMLRGLADLLRSVSDDLLKEG